MTDGTRDCHHATNRPRAFLGIVRHTYLHDDVLMDGSVGQFGAHEPYAHQHIAAREEHSVPKYAAAALQTHRHDSHGQRCRQHQQSHIEEGVGQRHSIAQYDSGCQQDDGAQKRMLSHRRLQISQLGNHRQRVGGSKDGIAGHQHVGTGLYQPCSRAQVNAAVHFYQCLGA